MSIEALPHHRAILTLPKRCLVVTMSQSAPERRPIDRPISRMVETKSSAKPPRVSATRGMYVKPIERQLGRLEASLCWTPTWRAWPWVRAASDNVRDWRGNNVDVKSGRWSNWEGGRRPGEKWSLEPALEFRAQSSRLSSIKTRRCDG